MTAARAFDAAARAVALYLEVGWHVTPKLLPLAVSDGAARSAARTAVTGRVLMFPDGSGADISGDASRFYLACAAHAAAHLTWSTQPFERGRLTPLQIALVGTIEDARVERLAMQRYPGLRRWWRPFHTTDAQTARTASALIARLARALFDPDYADTDGWVKKGRRLFEEAFERNGGADASMSRHIGNLLGNDLGQMRVQFNAKTYAQAAAYRDDNVFLWIAEPTPVAPAPGDANDARSVSAGQADMGEPDPAEAGALAISVTHYREWDYVIRRYRNDFCRVETLRAVASDAAAAMSHANVVQEQRVRASLRAARQRMPAEATRAYEGDAIDLDACIAARIETRRGLTPDINAFFVTHWRRRAHPVAVLLDLSASSGFSGKMNRALALGRLLGRALTADAWPFAMYGFHSDGRRRVRFHVFKAFDEPWNEAVETALRAARPGLSTRFGAALRHLAAQVAPELQGNTHATAIVVSDGEPFDIDSFDPRYLREDMRCALRELAAQRIDCACLSLDAASIDVAEAMFGRTRVALVSGDGGAADALRRVLAFSQ
ncbi:hypothetical protein H3V53_34460 [Paraburkholderia bengalensis]|uniref:VWA domain-containing protein n=1 Tax=Paraburkholderia bengalensis TaxID=2747562 RepID=A0ABU8J373_9BURK